MRRAQFSIAYLLLAFIAGVAQAIDPESFDDPGLQARYQHLTRELRCLQCQNESIADSNASLAGDLRREVRKMLAAGKSDDEILKFLTDRYGDFVLYQPPVAGRTWILWAAPGVLLIAALGIAILVIRRRTGETIEEPAINAEDEAL